MYIIKNALRCIGRAKGRNILIGIIVLVIATSACIGLSIRQAAQSAKEDTLSGMNITATISVDRQSMMGNMKPGEEGGSFDRDSFKELMGETSSLTLEEYQTYAEAESVQEFYYTMTVSFNETDEFEAVTSDEEEEETTENTEVGFQGISNSGFGGGAMKNMMGGRNMSNGDFSVIGYSSDTAMTSFVDGTASIVDGEVFKEGTEVYNCIISQELATYNDISVGDAVTLENPNNEEETYELTVVGIYSDSSSNEGFQMMMGTDPANEIYMSYEALAKIIEASEEVSTTVTDEDTDREYETALTGNTSATYVFADTEHYEKFEEEARELGLSDSYSISSQDASAFENSLVPLETLSTMAGWFLLVILIIGAIILIVMNIFNIRERKYEIGVLMAIGMKKGHVAMQFLTEVFVVTLIAVVIGIGVGGVSAVPVTNALLENQIVSSADKAEEMQGKFGRENNADMGSMDGKGKMEKPSGDFSGIEKMFGSNAANYVSEIHSAMNFTVVLQMLGIAVLLTLIAGAVSMLFVMRYEPLKILANRD